jgi:hypothetical protein
MWDRVNIGLVLSIILAPWLLKWVGLIGRIGLARGIGGKFTAESSRVSIIA